MQGETDRKESLRMELYTDNEKMKLQSGGTLHWKGMDIGGKEKRDLNLKMETYINGQGEIEKGISVQLKAPKLEIPEKILDQKLNKEEVEGLKQGQFFSLKRDSGVFLVKIDPRINGVVIRTPAEVGIREKLGGYKFNQSELQRSANGQQVGPKVYHSPKYGDFVANLQIKQDGLTNEYKYTNVINISRKEAEQLKPLLNDNKGEWTENDLDKVLDVMGADKSVTPGLIKSKEYGKANIISQDKASVVGAKNPSKSSHKDDKQVSISVAKRR